MTAAERRELIAVLVFCVGATISLGWAYRNVSALSATYQSGGGSGGIGAVSAGLTELASVIVPFAIVVWLSSRVRERGLIARRLRRAHQFSAAVIALMVVLLAIGVLTGAFSGGVDPAWTSVLAGALIGGALWLPLQLFFASAFAGLWIRPVS